MSSTSSTYNLEALDVDQKYEVFLNFRGCDTRSGFTSHLYSRLSEANIITYRDDKELPEGGEIGPELLKAINESAVAIPIFSINYAKSEWCLRELVEINNRRRSNEMMVVPIFYHVKPSMVRYQTDKFGEAFASHQQKQKYDNETIDEWKKALHDIASLCGCEIPSDKYRDECELVKHVTEKMSRALKKTHVEIPEDLVGLGYHLQKILKMLSLETLSVRIIGIHGMGGIGKTTLSKFVYNEILSKFEGSSFLENAGSKSKEDLKTKLESDILAGNRTKPKRFGGKKVLIVVDDVDENTQIEYLIGKQGEQVASGSRIILTTRNKDVLQRVGVHESYELSQMNYSHSLQLFCKHAFQKDNPEEEFAILSEQIVKTTGGLPLALEVIGSSLRNKWNKDVWEIKLDKLRKVPHEKVREKLRTSFDDELDKRQKNIFLDIACFFIGLDQGIVLHFWDKSLYPSEAIDVLKQKSLIKIHGNLLWMHDQLRDLGREIDREGGISKLEEQTRLWDRQEATEIFKKQRGTEKIQGICVEFDEKSFPYSVEAAFARLPEVRLFWVKSHFPTYPDQPLSATSSKFPHVFSEAFAKLYKAGLFSLKRHFRNYSDQRRFSSELRWLSWHQFPYMYIETSSFSLVNLTILDLSYSRFTIDWDGWTHIKMAENLKVLNLTGCENLVKTPEFSSHPLLERLILEGCSALVEIDESMGMLEHLVHLNLKGCVKLRKMPKDPSRLESLTGLLLATDGIFGAPKLCGMELEAFVTVYNSLKNCTSLDKTLFTKLCLNDDRITLVPDYIGQLVHLVELHLFYCYSLKKLPESIEGLVSLTNLKISNSGIEELPNSIGCLKNLRRLGILDTPIRELPSTIGMAKKLEEIDVGSCRLLRGGLPMLPESLSTLFIPWEIVDAVLVSDLSYLINLSRFEIHLNGWAPEGSLIEIPGPWWKREMERLGLAFSRITTLHPDLRPLSPLTHLTLDRCVHLQSIPNLPSNLEELAFYGCESLEITISDLSHLTNLSSLIISKSPLIKLEGLHSLESLTYLDLQDLVVSKLDELPESLYILSITRCENLERLPQMSQYKELGMFHLRGCPNLVEIHGRLESLKELEVECCKSLIKIPDVLNVETLEWVTIMDCPKLFNESSIDREGPILTDNSSKSEFEGSFMRNMLRICGYSLNEEEKGKGKRKRKRGWVEEEEEEKEEKEKKKKSSEITVETECI